jgi:peptidoglycan/LPS O-acetylase OafA/YrhL
MNATASDALTIPRRPDLDAVRAFAMLLGIALHAALSFATIPWIVQDSHRNEVFSLFFYAVHGFRMPVFFLVSGFFTAMLWRKRGLPALLKQRAKRVLLPCMLGLVTIVPAVSAVSVWAMFSGVGSPQTDDGSVAAAARRGDQAAIRGRLDAGGDINAVDLKIGATPLSWAAMRGDVDVVRLLIERGVNVNCRNRDGSSPLLSAAFLGRPDVVKILMSSGADVSVRNDQGTSALEATKVPADFTRGLAELIGIPLGPEEELVSGRAEAARLLDEAIRSSGAALSPGRESPRGGLEGLRSAYQRLISSDLFLVHLGSSSFHLIQSSVFHHLWFLWFLCWMVPIFAVVAWAIDKAGWAGPPRWATLSPLVLTWMVPLTVIPLLLMGIDAPPFGPDTSAGLVPKPHLLVFYGLFFAFGAIYFDAGDDEGRLGRRWWLLLPAALLVALPIGLFMAENRPAAALAEAVYSWAMCLGLMGLFRAVLTEQNRTIRYVSDSSYWLYLTHLPLIIAAQVIVRDWPMPAFVKFVIICSLVTGFLLLLYDKMVRYTWIGRMLNGPRTRGVMSESGQVPTTP